MTRIADIVAAAQSNQVRIEPFKLDDAFTIAAPAAAAGWRFPTDGGDEAYTNSRVCYLNGTSLHLRGDLIKTSAHDSSNVLLGTLDPSVLPYITTTGFLLINDGDGTFWKVGFTVTTDGEVYLQGAALSGDAFEVFDASGGLSYFTVEIDFLLRSAVSDDVN